MRPRAASVALVLVALAGAATGCTWGWSRFRPRDASGDAPADAPGDVPGDEPGDATADGEAACAPLPTTSVQRSCPDVGMRGCGLVEVSTGPPFVMGAPGERNADFVQHDITVTGTLLVDRTEVTVARFEQYWAAGHPAPPDAIGYPGGCVSWTGPVHEPTRNDVDARCNFGAADPNRQMHPLNCVDWWTAMAFCVWDGGRLATEAEWEWIARYRPIAGVNSPRLYPWGDEVPRGSATEPCDRAQINMCPGEDGANTRRVGSFGAPGGLFDLAGNVGEWLADNFVDYHDARCWGDRARVDPVCDVDPLGARTRRGGSYGALPTVDPQTAARYDTPVGDAYDSAGFRCVRTR